MHKKLTIKIEISPGDLVDRLTILEIKKDKISDKNKLRSIYYELQQIRSAYEEHIPDTHNIDQQIILLTQYNKALWDLEDKIRFLDNNSDYGDDFISTARKIFITNDLRAAVKKQINSTLGASFSDEKSF